MPTVLAALAASFTLVASAPPPAPARGSAYCRKVQARASGDAALLIAPQLFVQALRIPAADIELAVSRADETQLRAGLTFSPLDLHRGLRLLDAAEADCEQHEAADRIQRLLVYAEEFGRLGAVRRQLAWLEERRAEWEAVVARVEQRLAARASTVLEVSELRVRVSDLERKLAQARGEVDRLAARGAVEEVASVPELVSSFRARATRYEAALGGLRRLDAWDVKLTGGIIPDAPGERVLDWYAVVEVAWSLGGFARNASERRYLAARDEERSESWYELEPQLRVFRQHVASAAAQARRELATVEREAAFVAGTRSALERSDAPSAAHVLAALTLHEILVGADRVYLSALLDALSPLEEKAR